MTWQIAEARRQLSELIRAARNEPQLILNGDRLVAALIDPETFGEYVEWMKTRDRQTLGAAFEEFRATCAEDDYELGIPSRSDRPNPFAV